MDLYQFIKIVKTLQGESLGDREIVKIEIKNKGEKKDEI